MSQSLSQKLEQRLTCAQRLVIEVNQLQFRRDLVYALHGNVFVPKATCGKCHHQLTDLEIMKGFRENPRDYTTRCPKCDRRFLPRLYHSTQSGGADVSYYCPAQTLDRISELVNVPFDEFRMKFAGEYHSAVIHFGGLKQAYKKLGLTYAYEADLDWEHQVKDFIGKMPDTVIAELVGTKVGQIRRLRLEMGVKAYSRLQESEFEDHDNES